MKTKLLILFMLFYGIVFFWSMINPKDYFTWLLEVLPAIIGLIILIVTFKKFRFTDLSYLLILIHCIILMIGGHYTYAEVPLFDWIKEILHQSRNNYDKVGHFAQGFVPAIITREILIRKNLIASKGWLTFIVITICMAISVTYEFIEWFVTLMTGESAEAFLGTQGYIWDTQSDMFMATIGAISAVTLLNRLHDRQIHKLISI